MLSVTVGRVYAGLRSTAILVACWKTDVNTEECSDVASFMKTVIYDMMDYINVRPKADV